MSALVESRSAGVRRRALGYLHERQAGTTRQIADMLNEPVNLVAHALRDLEEEGLVARTETAARPRDCHGQGRVAPKVWLWTWLP